MLLILLLIAPLTSYAGKITSYSKYSSKVQIESKVGNKRSIIRPSILVPVFQRSESLIHVTVIGMSDTMKALEGNFGLGARHILKDNIIGVYGFYDVRNSSHNNIIHQLTIGGEWFKEFFEFRFNVYLPKKQSFKISEARTLPHYYKSGSKVDIKLLSSTKVEQALSGFDIDFGTQLPSLPQLTVRLAYYNFSSSDKRIQTRNGIRGVLQYQLYDFLELDTEISYDNQRKIVFFGGLNIRYNFDKYNRFNSLTRLEKKMTLIPIRDIDAVSGEGDLKDEIDTISIESGKGELIALVDTKNPSVIFIDAKTGKKLDHGSAKVKRVLKQIENTDLSKQEKVKFVGVKGEKLLSSSKIAKNIGGKLTSKNQLTVKEEMLVVSILNNISGADVTHPKHLHVKRLKKSQDKINKLKNEIKNLKTKNGNKTNGKIKNLEAQLEKSKKDYENTKVEFERSIENSKAEENKLKAKLEETQKEYTNKKEELLREQKSIQNKNKDLIEKLNASEKKEKQLEKDLVTAKKNTEQMKNNFEQAKKESSKSANELSELQKQHKVALETQQALEKDLSKAKNDVADTKSIIERINSEHKNREQDLQKTLNQYKEQHTQYQKQIKVMKKRDEINKRELQSKNQAKKLLQKELKKVKKQAIETENTLNQKISDLQNWYAEAEDEIEELNNRLQDVMSNAFDGDYDVETEIQQKTQELNERIESLNSECDSLYHQYEDECQYSKELEMQLEKNSQEFTHQENQLQSQIKQLSNQNHEITQIQSQLALELHNEKESMKKMKSTLDKLNSKTKSLESKTVNQNELKKQISVLEQELHIAEDVRNKAVMAQEGLMSQLDEVTSTLESTQKELQDRNDYLQQLEEYTRKSNNTAILEQVELESKIKDLENDLDEAALIREEYRKRSESYEKSAQIWKLEYEKQAVINKKLKMKIQSAPIKLANSKKAKPYKKTRRHSITLSSINELRGLV